MAHPGQPRNERLDLVFAHRAPLLEIGAGTKVLARAPHDQATHGAIVLQLLQCIFDVPDELTPQQRSELDRIEERQRDLADQARQAIEDMRRRADDLQDADPQSAAAMKSAADTGEQRELPREMDNAADRVDQNQMQMAQTSQQAARQTLQRMLDDIRDTKRARAEELIRRLASLIESIQRLITVQENELVALEIAKAESDFGGRDRAMIRLNQNTQSVAVEARTAGQEARRIARLLDRAADAQGASVIALRNRPVDAGTAHPPSNLSL